MITEIQEYETIWFPAIYSGRETEEYTIALPNVSVTRLIELVQLRSAEDGEWTIANGFAGENEEKMRRMMAFVSDEKNIRQCLAHIDKEGSTAERTVDWVCRELANASKYMVRD
jgi:hypothetical protein